MNLVTVCPTCHAILHKQQNPPEGMTWEDFHNELARYLGDYYAEQWKGERDDLWYPYEG